MASYYNENDAYAAAWLRELIKAGLIADGEVDTRSIVDVQPGDLRGFVQCHFFAGIGGWSYALRLAGWGDAEPVWTGSCPCQPWSMAGRGEGANDPRHLWPAWFRLIDECRPATVFGEQVASEDGRYWLDLVYVDLEARGYAIGAFDLPACCIGAPHKRARLWFVANADIERCKGQRLHVRERGPFAAGAEAARRGEARALDHAERSGAERIARGERRQEPAPQGRREVEGRRGLQALDSGAACVLGDANGSRLALRSIAEVGRGAVRHEGAAIGAAGAARGFWERCEWVWHDDGVYRAVEPESFPLAPRLPGDMEQIHAYGNAIVPQVAAAFIAAYRETRMLAAVDPHGGATHD